MLLKKINDDLVASMKSKDTLKLSVLRMVKAAIKNKAIEKKIEELPDDGVLDVLQKQVKQRRDSIEEFKKANRHDLVEKESKELEILAIYLPKPLTTDELKSIVEKAIASTGAKTKADMGKVMKAVMGETKGKADGKQISQLVNQLLS